MSPVAQKKTEQYQAFLLALQDVLGVVVGEEKRSLILEKLMPVMSSHGHKSIEVLADAMRDESASELRASVLQAITSQDSTWFGNSDITRLLTEYVLPGLINQNKLNYRIWMLGCGSGQNAYSLAMTIDAFKRDYDMACSVEIVATDLSESTVKQAASGLYEATMLNGLPEHYRQKYMNRAGDEWEVEPSISAMLQFKTCSLIEGFENMGHFDLVICPDMLIYFYNGMRKQILNQFADLLDPSGMLIVGANESVTPFCKRFEQINHETGTFYRQLPDA